MLGRYFHSWQAEIVRGVLESAGLQCMISPRSDAHGGAVTDTSTGFRVLVNAEAVELAKQAIADARAQGSELPDDDDGSGEA